MGSLENGAFAKRTPLFRSSLSTSRGDRHPFLVRPRSRFARFLLFEKVDYLQLICTIAVFFFVVILFQAFLPVSVTEKSSDSWEKTSSMASEDMGYFKDEIVDLDFGEGVRFVPSKLLEKFSREAREGNLSLVLSRPVIRAALRRPQLALVVADLSADGMQLMMTSVAISLQEIGYSIQVYSLEDGPVHSVWKNLGLSVTILQISNKVEMTIDWLNYDGILVNSLEARDFVSGLLQEPFKSVPVIWTIHERALAFRLRQYTSNGQIQLINDWKRALNRATVVVFPNYILPMMYSTLDTGNYYVIPSSADEAWEAYNFLALYNEHDSRVDMGYESNDLIVAIAGSHFSYNGSWLEHALVLQALVPLIADFPHDSSSGIHLKVGIISGNSSSAYEVALEVIALKLGYPRGTVRHIGIDRDVSAFLSIADLVIYGSFLEEQSFPPILIQAMCLGKPVIAPDLAMIRKYIDDRVNGYLFPKEDIGMLTQVIFQAISKGTLSLLARNIASIARGHAKNLMVSDTIEGYAMLLENVIKFPSEVAMPKAVSDIPLPLKQEWQWHLFEGVDSRYANKTLTGYNFLYKLEELSNPTSVEASLNVTDTMDVAFSITDWEEAKLVEMENARKRREEEEMKDRTDQPHGTWEEVYRSAKRADRTKNELHERDDRELERTGQPLCIYEPYFGEGTWPSLHRTSLYRGIGLSTKGRRPGFDDIDAPSRLPLLNDPYYRDVLGEYGAFFALANRIDRIHKNAWIGFQSWRVSARKASLSKTAESMLLEAIQARKHGDVLYFWVRMDKDPRNPLNQDFWSFCDSVNAGNCRFAVAEALRKMYGIKRDWDSLPPMPMDGDTWSVMYSWALPTRSFLEFVMFSRMFVDALDAQIYNEHHQSGYCYLSLSKDRHCYSRVLELLVNVWAYHSARRMVYINPETGVMHEHHKLKSRRGQLLVRWFSFTTLKSMDEDLAEEWDSEHPERRWLWPSTGEIFWQGVYERERHQRHRQREEKRQHSKDKISRMRRRAHQKALGKYVKPPPEEMGSYNSTLAASNHS